MVVLIALFLIIFSEKKPSENPKRESSPAKKDKKVKKRKNKDAEIADTRKNEVSIYSRIQSACVASRLLICHSSCSLDFFFSSKRSSDCQVFENLV